MLSMIIFVWSISECTYQQIPWSDIIMAIRLYNSIRQSGIYEVACQARPIMFAMPYFVLYDIYNKCQAIYYMN